MYSHATVTRISAPEGGSKGLGVCCLNGRVRGFSITTSESRVRHKDKLMPGIRRHGGIGHDFSGLGALERRYENGNEA